MGNEPISVGVLSSHNSEEIKAILDAAEHVGHEPIWLGDENRSNRIGTNQVRLDPEGDVIVNRLPPTNIHHSEDNLGLPQREAGLGTELNRSLPVFIAVQRFGVGTGADPVRITTAVGSSTAGSSLTPPPLDGVVGIGRTRHSRAASIADRRHQKYPVLRGRELLSEYRVDIEKRADNPGSDSDHPAEA